MTMLRFMLGLVALPALLSVSTNAQQRPIWQISADSPLSLEIETSPNTIVRGTNGVTVRFGYISGTATNWDDLLLARQATVDETTGQAEADGHVRIYHQDQLWVGEQARYNFYSNTLETEQFRTGKSPLFAEGKNLRGDSSNHVYTARHGYATTDDVDKPFGKIRASTIRIVPGEYIEAYNAVLFVDNVPMFYYPYYRRNLGEKADNFVVTPGYRSIFGPFLLGTYTWFLDDQLDGKFHLDYRFKRGVGLGPDATLHMGQWGDVTMKYYFLHDQDPTARDIVTNLSVPANRQRVFLTYDATPCTNLDLKAAVRYQSDPLLNHDFFERDYREDPQPTTFFNANRQMDNFSLDALAQPRVNDFFENVERLPDLKLTGFRRQVGSLPLYYQSESSLGFYRRSFAQITNSAPATNDYSAFRGDTYHQLLLPETFFGWLNVTPRVGGRFTYYGEAGGPGGTNEEAARGVFNTGAEFSFKLSRLWPALRSDLLDLNGLRHIIEPSLNYVFIPAPNVRPSQVPQFDYELPSLQLLPLDLPDYNSIDSIDSQNAVRWGLRNKLQTKRGDQIADLLDWDVFTDWRLKPRSDQSTFSDVYSDLVFRPRSWIIFESHTRYDISSGLWNMSFHNLTLRPNDTWSWGLGHLYLRDDLSPSPVALGEGNNLITSTFFYRLNENWGFRVGHQFEARDGRLEEQNYTVYRDMRSWTAAVSFRVQQNVTGPQDYTVAVTFSVKAAPRFALGSDAVRPYQMLGN